MIEVGGDVQANPMKCHPFTDAHADGGDLVLGLGAFLRPSHPDADAVRAHFAGHVEGGQRGGEPAFEVGHEGAHIGLAAFQVQHHISHALAGPMIGVLPAASGLEDRKAFGINEIARVGACPRRVERGVFEQPDQFARAAFSDCAGALLHRAHRLFVRHGTRRDAPFRCVRHGFLAGLFKGLRFNHRVTLACEIMRCS